MKVIADHMLLTDFGTVSGGTVGGTASAITLTCSPVVTALAAGQRYAFIFGSATTGATTLTVDSTSAGALQWRGQALVANDYATGDWGLFICDGTNFQAVIPPRLSAQTTDWTTDSTGGAVGDFIAFMDASESNAANKVLVTDFFKNVLANITTKALPVPADSMMIADSAASGAAKISTLQTLFDSVTGITEDATGATGDFLLSNDVSASNVAKKIKISSIQTLLAAIASTQETATSTTLFVTPAVQQRHPSSPKAWGNIDGTGTAALTTSYNGSGMTDLGTGNYRLSFTTAFSGATFCVLTAAGDAIDQNYVGVSAQTTGNVDVSVYNDGGAVNDEDPVFIGCLGDQ